MNLSTSFTYEVQTIMRKPKAENFRMREDDPKFRSWFNMSSCDGVTAQDLHQETEDDRSKSCRGPKIPEVSKDFEEVISS